MNRIALILTAAALAACQKPAAENATRADLVSAQFVKVRALGNRKEVRCAEWRVGRVEAGKFSYMPVPQW